MSKIKKQYVGKIGFCDNSALGITDIDGRPKKGGHYVYIREMIGANKCNVNIITSLETVRRNKIGKPLRDKSGNLITDYTSTKIDKVKKGYLYPIPKNDSNFTEWSAINLDGNIKNIKISDIKRIGFRKIKTRHKWYVGKFTKK